MTIVFVVAALIVGLGVGFALGYEFGKAPMMGDDYDVR